MANIEAVGCADLLMNLSGQKVTVYNISSELKANGKKLFIMYPLGTRVQVNKQ